jgi:predicted nucleotidyltransferase
MVIAVSEGIVQEIVRRIRGVAEPCRVILFGSAASGELNPDSDRDLLVLVDDASAGREQVVRWRQALRGLGCRIDATVMGVERFEPTKDIVGGLAYPPHHHGKVIYARP